MISLFVLDIDNTIAVSRYTGPLTTDEHWECLYAMCDPIPHVVQMAKFLATYAHQFLILTGRQEKNRVITEHFLKSVGFDNYKLEMRPDDDLGTAAGFKYGVFTKYTTFSVLRLEPIIVLDDDELFLASLKSMPLVIALNPLEMTP